MVQQLTTPTGRSVSDVEAETLTCDSEEGARFPMTTVSSGVWAEAIPLETAHRCEEVSGTGATLQEQLNRHGYLREIPASYRATPMGAHFELHMEQGPILKMEKQKIGVVSSVQAYKWYTIEIEGRAAHTGTTPYEARADALLGAARMIAHSNKVCRELSALASTGILKLEPGSTNTNPNKVSFSLDVRAADNATVGAVEEQLKTDFARLASEEPLPLSVTWRTDSNSPAVKFDQECIDGRQDVGICSIGQQLLVPRHDQRGGSRQRLHEQTLPDYDDLRAKQEASATTQKSGRVTRLVPWALKCYVKVWSGTIEDSSTLNFDVANFGSVR